MKFAKAFMLTLSALLLTGCYTQLQYSKTAQQKAEQEKKVEGYSWTGEEETERQSHVPAKSEKTKQSSKYVDGENYVPVHYKDHGYQNKWQNCNCNPYKTYNFYGDNYFSPSYGSFSTLHQPGYTYGYSPFYRGHMSPYYGHSFFGTRFSFTFGWGTPYYTGFYGSPYYHDFYWSRFGSPFAYNFHNYYGGGYYYGDDDQKDTNARYGPRSIGTNRVNTDVTRSRSGQRVSGQNAVRSNNSSVGTSRTRGGTNRNSGSSVNRNRGNNSDNSSSHSRSRGNIQRDENSRSSNILRYHKINRNERELESIKIDQSNTDNRLQRTKGSDVNSRNSRSTFFDRLKGFFQNNTSRLIENTGSVRIRSRSSNNDGSSFRTRSRDNNNRSSVDRNRSSSSNNSGSRGSSSSSSRSRSGGGGSDDGSSRSRGNN